MRRLTQAIIGLGNKGQPRQVDDWGALRAWLGGSRALTILKTTIVDAKRVELRTLRMESCYCRNG